MRPRTDTLTTDALQFRRENENVSDSANGEDEASMVSIGVGLGGSLRSGLALRGDQGFESQW